MLAGSSLGLGSLWSLVPQLPTAALILRRTIIEDRFLHANLPGYADFASRTRWRLLPGLW